MNHDADAWVGQVRRRSRPATREPDPRIIDIRYPILSEATLLHRSNLPPKALQRWSAEGIGPPAWRIGKHPRDLTCEVEQFERHAQIRRRSDGTSDLSVSRPRAREEAIAQAAASWARPREKLLLTEHEISQVTGLPSYRFTHRSERKALGVPHHTRGGGKVIRFDAEEIFCWETARLMPRRQVSSGT